ncbi:MAG: 50S ribosomal protein P1 [Thermoprotei archaeon]
MVRAHVVRRVDAPAPILLYLGLRGIAAGLAYLKYVYASLLLHSSGREINEENLKKVVEATGSDVDLAQIKAIVAALKDVNIDEAIKKGVAVSAPAQQASQAPAQEAQPQKPKEEKKEEAEEEVSAEGLGALFG